MCVKAIVLWVFTYSKKEEKIFPEDTPKLTTDNTKFAFELAQENYNGKAAVLYSVSDEMELVNKSTHQ